MGALLAIFLLDLATEQRSPSLSVLGLTDEVAHLATAFLFLAVVRPRVSRPFALAALAAAVLIDLDHLPYLAGQAVVGHRIGQDGHWPLHSALTVVVSLGTALRLRGDWRQIAHGVAFGVATHLIRDLATGGTPLLWPLTTDRFTLPYEIYAAVLVLLFAVSLRVGTRSTKEIRA